MNQLNVIIETNFRSTHNKYLILRKHTNWSNALYFEVKLLKFFSFIEIKIKKSKINIS